MIGTLTADYFVDHDLPAGGDGRSRTTAVNSFDALLALAGFGPGATVAVKGGPTVRRDGLFTYINNLTFVAYDGMVLLDGTRVAPTDLFTPHASLARCYVATWEHRYDWINSWCRIWHRGIPLKRRGTEAEVAATPGTYWVSEHDAASLRQPRRITAHFPGGVNPATDGGQIEITYLESALSVGDDSMIHGFHGRRFASYNGAFRMGDRAEASRILSEEGTTHNWVFGDGVFDDIVAVNAASDEYGAGGIMGTNFVSGPAEGKKVTLNRPLFIVDPSVYANQVDTGRASLSAYYCHGTSGYYDEVIINDAVVTGTRYGIAIGALQGRVTGALMMGLPDGNSIGLSGAKHMIVRKGLFLDIARLVECVSIDAEGVALVTTHRSSGGYFWNSGTNGPNRVRLVDNYIVSPGGYLAASNNPAFDATIRGNILDGADFIYALNALSPGSSIDNNVYRRADPNTLSVTINGTNIDFAEWRGRGYDVNSVDGDPRWQSGRPSASNLKFQLGSGSPATGKVGNPIVQSEIDAYLARPRTLAQARDYLIYRAPIYAVA